jgi:hypothetical protein
MGIRVGHVRHALHITDNRKMLMLLTANYLEGTPLRRLQIGKEALRSLVLDCDIIEEIARIG